MSTTSDLAKRLDGMFVRFATETEDEAAIRRVATAREAAKHIDELERENARLREALFETHLDLVAYADIAVARKRLVKRRAALAGSEKP